MVSEIVHQLIDGEREDFRNGLQRLLNRVPRRKSTTEPGFFTYFFLGSVLTLPYTKLNGEIGVRASSVKITSDHTVKLAFKIQKDGKTKLVFRTIAIVRNIEDSQHLTINEFKEALGSLGLTQDELNNCEFEGEIVHIKETEEGRKVNLEKLDVLEKGELNSEVIRDLGPLPKYDEKTAKFKKVKDGVIGQNSLGDALEQFSNEGLEANVGKLSESAKGAENLFRNLAQVYRSEMKLGLEAKEKKSKKLGLSDDEAPAHGFVYGALAMNFRYKYELRIWVERAAGKGFVDLVVGSNAREFRVELKGRTNTAQDAERQSGREGYDKAPIIFSFGEEEKAESV